MIGTFHTGLQSHLDKNDDWSRSRVYSSADHRT